MSYSPPTIRLTRSEVLALGSILDFEAAGHNLGSCSARRMLNQRAELQWTTEQWQRLLAPYYQAVISPTPPDLPEDCFQPLQNHSSTPSHA